LLFGSGFGGIAMTRARWLLLFPALLLASPTAQAMQIQFFDHMAAQDRQDYMNLMMTGAEKVLMEAGRQSDAAKVHQLFNEIRQGDALPLGEAAFEGNLDHARVFDAQRHLNDPSARRLEVEDAMVVTLKKNGMALPDGFFSIGSNFKPKYPPPH
jgi:hypothetical protein